MEPGQPAGFHSTGERGKCISYSLGMLTPISTRKSSGGVCPRRNGVLPHESPRVHEIPFHELRTAARRPAEWHSLAGKTDTTPTSGIDIACRTITHGAARWGARMRKTPILAGMATATGLVATLGLVVAPAAGAQA